MSFAAKIANSRALVYDLRWEEDGVSHYAILEVDKHQHDAFKAARANPRPDVFLNQFGTILYQGEGEPSEEIKAECREKYKMYTNS